MLDSSVKISGFNMKNLPKPNNKKTLELLREYRNGNIGLKESIVLENIRLVLSVIQSFKQRTNENTFDDIFQIGCIGLIKAIDNFDTTKEFQFSTYAVPMIIGELRRHLRDNTLLRVSRNLKDIAYKTLKYKEEYVCKYSKEPTIKEIAEHLDTEEEMIVLALNSTQEIYSIYQPVSNSNSSDEDLCIIDQIKEEKDYFESATDNIFIENILSKLQDREKNIFHLRFIQDKTQTEVAEEIGVSQAQVSRLEKRILGIIKKHISK